MRRLQLKPKDRRKVPIPDELRDSLLEVHELIQQAKQDPDIRLAHDDAIQVGSVCGGRFGKKPRDYVLTYSPTGDRERGRWHLTLHRTEIEDLGDGRMAELLLYCCTAPECRSKFREADETCFFCDYTEDGNFGKFDFPEAATRLSERGVTGLTENSTKADVGAALGTPAKEGGGIKSPSLGYIWPWVNYRRTDCQLRIEFNKSQTRLRNITILEPDWEPGK